MRGVEPDRLRVRRGAPRRGARRWCRPVPATTWAFVTTRPSAASQPLPCTPSPQAVPSTFTTLRPARATSRSRAILESGGPTSGIGALDLRERVEARQRLQHHARRRQPLVQLREDRRALDRLAQLARARGVERHGARRSRRAPSPRAATSTAPPSPSSRPSPLAEPAAQPEPEHLERRTRARRRAAAPPRARRAARRASASPPRAAAAPAASPANAPPRNPASERAPDDQTLRVAPDGHERHEGDDDPVEQGHTPKCSVAPA